MSLSLFVNLNYVSGMRVRRTGVIVPAPALSGHMLYYICNYTNTTTNKKYKTIHHIDQYGWMVVRNAFAGYICSKRHVSRHFSLGSRARPFS